MSTPYNRNRVLESVLTDILLVHTGCEPNLIKKKLVKPALIIDLTDLLELHRITANPVDILGSLTVDILGCLVKFHVVRVCFDQTSRNIM